MVSKMSDSVFDALFSQAVIDNFYEELNSLPPDDELAKIYTFSHEHEMRMKKLFAREALKEKARITLVWGKRAAAIVILAASILFGSLMFVPEVRAVIMEIVTEWYEKFVRFTSTSTETDMTSHEPTYIPSGFQEELRDEMETMKTIVYTNDDGVIIQFESGLSGGSISVDSEGRDYRLVRSDGIDYYIFSTNDMEKMNAVVWETDGQMYHISSQLPIDEILKIAFSVASS